MKLYVYAFLLFLLLLNLSLSATARGIPISSVTKGRMGSRKLFKSKWVSNVIKKMFKEIAKNDTSAPPPNSPPIQIDGLSQIKNYLSDYGYIQSSGPFNDSYDPETISAIKTYQQYFNLQVTGDLNNQTIQQLSLQRCGVPDINFSYEFIDNVSYPKAGHRWFPKGNNLTYGFLPESQIPSNATKVFKDSFTRWANATKVLNLTETTYDDADIKVGFYNFTYLGIDDEVYGGSVIISQPTNNVGDILLDATLFWALPSENNSLSWEDGILDLESAAMHQIGHLLGLDHSNKTQSIMYPYILPSQQRKVQLSDYDKLNIQQQYSHSSNSNYSSDGSRLGVLLVTTLYAGFGYVLLAY